MALDSTRERFLAEVLQCAAARGMGATHGFPEVSDRLLPRNRLRDNRHLGLGQG
jgi:hypothetical protein